MVHHRKTKTMSSQAQNIISTGLVTVESVTFDCTVSTEEPAIKRLTKALPSADNLAWAAAFIDRAGHLNE
ncbi:hypothetical protein FGRMN_10250, partial [Fusarium graminum]